jgi:NAD(P)-dependent dehydrogenase (short-subunit alcohol dehydrogenase family)
VGRALAARRDWQVYLLGTNRQRGCEVIEGIPCATFLEADVSNYDELARVFHKIYKDNGRLDFVFANAGVLETHDICARYTEDEVPPEPNLKTIDVNFKGVVYTTYLALHYFRQSLGTGVEANLIYTGSCLSFYPSSIPLYTGTKRVSKTCLFELAN